VKRPAKFALDLSQNQISAFPGLQERGLLLSLFPGIDLLGRGFEAEGFCVVRGPDLMWGQSVETFHAPARVFDGIIAGTPCQGFSMANRTHRDRDRVKSESAIVEFARVVTEAKPKWFLLENVPTVPNVKIEGYTVQRFDLRASEVGLPQSRLRHFQFGSDDASVLVPERDSSNVAASSSVTLEPCCMASEGKRQQRRSFARFCELQGLPASFDLPGWGLGFKYAAVGNAVPVPMAATIARAIRNRYALPAGVKLCACQCGRIVTGRRKSAGAACRKRLQRKRENPEPD
jgi:DNA (cytosine-5)-methyltransferase 1